MKKLCTLLFILLQAGCSLERPAPLVDVTLTLPLEGPRMGFSSSQAGRMVTADSQSVRAELWANWVKVANTRGELVDLGTPIQASQRALDVVAPWPVYTATLSFSQVPYGRYDLRVFAVGDRNGVEKDILQARQTVEISPTQKDQEVRLFLRPNEDLPGNVEPLSPAGPESLAWDLPARSSRFFRIELPPASALSGARWYWLGNPNYEEAGIGADTLHWTIQDKDGKLLAQDGLQNPGIGSNLPDFQVSADQGPLYLTVESTLSTGVLPSLAVKMDLYDDYAVGSRLDRSSLAALVRDAKAELSLAQKINRGPGAGLYPSGTEVELALDEAMVFLTDKVAAAAPLLPPNWLPDIALFDSQGILMEELNGALSGLRGYKNPPVTIVNPGDSIVLSGPDTLALDQTGTFVLEGTLALPGPLEIHWTINSTGIGAAENALSLVLVPSLQSTLGLSAGTHGVYVTITDGTGQVYMTSRAFTLTNTTTN